MHTKVLSANYMCQNCPQICDDLEVFKQQRCPCSFEKGPAEALPAAARPAVTSPAGAKPLAIRGRVGKIGGTFMEVRCLPSAAKATCVPPEPKAPDQLIPTESRPEKHPLPRNKPSLPIESRTMQTPKSRARASAAVRAAIEEAEQELQKLLVLQALANERKHLEELLLQKSQQHLKSTANADVGTLQAFSK